jgi:hypothetical protein
MDVSSSSDFEADAADFEVDSSEVYLHPTIADIIHKDIALYHVELERTKGIFPIDVLRGSIAVQLLSEYTSVDEYDNQNVRLAVRNIVAEYVLQGETCAGWFELYKLPKTELNTLDSDQKAYRMGANSRINKEEIELKYLTYKTVKNVLLSTPFRFVSLHFFHLISPRPALQFNILIPLNYYTGTAVRDPASDCCLLRR